jgi:membrane dipeptidase
MDYSLEHHLHDVYSRFPESGNKPVIGLTSNHHETDADIRERYYQQVVAAGGVPLIIPPVPDAGVIGDTLNSIDAVVLTGGADFDPKWMGEEAQPLLGNVNEVRDLPELLTARLAYNRQMPMLGICRGMQTMAIAFGGHVAQDMAYINDRDGEKTVVHDQKEEREVKTHMVSFDENSVLYNIYGSSHLQVNSFHHQAVDRTGSLFRPVAWAEDGIIEAMESTEHKPMFGVQWHPEWLLEEGRMIFDRLIAEARLFKKAKRLHDRIITLDSHCDTPMFFPQGADFSKRDPKILVDLHKMTDGRQDVATMVAYVPQPPKDKEWKDVMPIDTDSPTDYANLIFDKIEAIVEANKDYMAIARNEGDILANKLQRKKSIMLGIENALALGNDISLVETFARRGVVYFTLCHNGDNQVCDSARRSLHTWGGISPFGAEVIAEMNRCGVMADLSHAGEQSFYDALDISKKPVVCSHSNCKAVCNHERNLSDGQLRALAAKGGVCQITLYEGFVSLNPKEADIIKAMEHLDHAVRIMGIDHVGIGSDFDGDGGITGLKDSSEMLLFTRQLLKRRYSDDDIRKIWGGNWLRVLGINRTDVL